MPSVIDHVRLLASNVSWYGRMLLSEVHSFPHRIQMLAQRTYRHSDPIDLGPMFEQGPSGETVPCKATIARTQYVEFLLARFPWASDADIALALDGWDKGTRWALDISDSDNTHEAETRQRHLAFGD